MTWTFVPGIKRRSSNEPQTIMPTKNIFDALSFNELDDVGTDTDSEAHNVSAEDDLQVHGGEVRVRALY